MTQSSASAQPNKTVNESGDAIIQFNGTSDYLQNNAFSFSGNSNLTIFFVGKLQTQPSSPWRSIFHTGYITYSNPNPSLFAYTGGQIGINTWNGDLYGTTPASLSDNYRVYTVQLSNANTSASLIWINGISQNLSYLQGNASTNQNFGVGLTIGGWSSSYFSDLSLSEFIIINRSLSSSERQAIESYLGQKWAAIVIPTTPSFTIGSLLRSNSVVNLAWTASQGNGVNISYYEYAIGTTSGGSDVLNWQNAGDNLSVLKSGLRLTPGKTYYLSVRAVNIAGTESEISTKEVRVPGQYIGF